MSDAIKSACVNVIGCVNEHREAIVTLCAELSQDAPDIEAAVDYLANAGAADNAYRAAYRAMIIAMNSSELTRTRA